MNSLHLQQSGIEQVIERYQEPLYWHIRRMVVSHEDAEDVLQETFIKIFQHYAKERIRTGMGVSDCYQRSVAMAPKKTRDGLYR